MRERAHPQGRLGPAVLGSELDIVCPHRCPGPCWAGQPRARQHSDRLAEVELTGIGERLCQVDGGARVIRDYVAEGERLGLIVTEPGAALFDRCGDGPPKTAAARAARQRKTAT